MEHLLNCSLFRLFLLCLGFIKRFKQENKDEIVVKWQQVQKSTLYMGSKGWPLCCNPHKSCLNWTKSSGRKWYQEAWYRRTMSPAIYFGITWQVALSNFMPALPWMHPSTHLILIITITCTSLSLFSLFFSKSCQIVSYLPVTVFQLHFLRHWIVTIFTLVLVCLYFLNGKVCLNLLVSS